MLANQRDSHELRILTKGGEVRWVRYLMRPVRDAYVDASGTIWILSSGAPPEHAPDLPGGWVLARYGLLPMGAGGR